MGPVAWILSAFLAAALIALAILIVIHRQLKDEHRKLREKARSQEARIREEARSSVEETNRLFAILGSMTEGVIVVDPEQRILLINPALANAFSFRAEEAEGRYFWEMFRDPEINAMMREALEKRSAVRKEHEALLTETVFDIQLSPVSIGNDFIGMVAVFRDITVFKAFDRMRSEFVANVSHELKTPLTSILGFVETLKEGGIDDTENRMKFLQVIEDQSRHLHELIEDLLYLSRLEGAREPLKASEVDLPQLIGRIKMRFAPLLKENRLTLDADLGTVKTAKAEVSGIERALSNLIDNAVKYNRPGGRIRVEAAETPGEVILRVVDTGIGIAATDLSRVFERFFRADRSRSRELGGTGLGLSIVKHIAERHGGKVEVDSTLGEGSVFSLLLPK